VGPRGGVYLSAGSTHRRDRYPVSGPVPVGRDLLTGEPPYSLAMTDGQVPTGRDIPVRNVMSETVREVPAGAMATRAARQLFGSGIGSLPVGANPHRRTGPSPRPTSRSTAQSTGSTRGVTAGRGAVCHRRGITAGWRAVGLRPGKRVTPGGWCARGDGAGGGVGGNVRRHQILRPGYKSGCRTFSEPANPGDFAPKQPTCRLHQ
jgi:hypothetical protein